MRESRQHPTESRASMKRQFYEGLCLLVEAEAWATLEYILEEAEDILARLQAEEALREGWKGEQG